MSRPLLAARMLTSATACVVVAACNAAGPASSSRSATATAGDTPTPSGIVSTPTPPGGPTVLATGVAATPSGTVAFVMVLNDSTPRSGITVTANATSSNGHAPVSGQAEIGSMAADATQAVMVQLSVPANDSVGSVTASVSAGNPAATATNPFTVASASFVADPISPSIDVTVTTTTAGQAKIVAVCYHGTTIIGGGMQQTISVPSGHQTTVRLAAAVTDTPDSCRGFAYPA